VPAAGRRSDRAELAAGELAKARPGVLVGPDRVAVVPRIRRDLLGDRPHLALDARAMLGVPEQRGDPVLRRLEILLDEEATEEDADADVGEGAECEEAPRGRDECADLRIALLELADDRANRLVDERDPEVVRRSHADRMH